jgi:hypothetical protein
LALRASPTYRLLDCDSNRERTRQNVLDSDGTAILFHDALGGGTLLTLNLRKREGKPRVVIDASKISESAAAAEIARFVEEHEIRVLNVAGPRLSGWRQGYTFAMVTVGEVIALIRGDALVE